MIWGGGATSSESEVVKTEKTLREVATEQRAEATEAKATATEKRAEADAAKTAADEAEKTADEKAAAAAEAKTAAEKAVSDAEAAKEAVKTAEAAVEPAKEAAKDAANAVDAMEDLYNKAKADEADAKEDLAKAKEEQAKIEAGIVEDKTDLETIKGLKTTLDDANKAVSDLQTDYDNAKTNETSAKEDLAKAKEEQAKLEAGIAEDKADLIRIKTAKALIDNAEDDEAREIAQKAYDKLVPTTGTVEQNEGWIAEKEAKLVDAKKDVAEKQAAVDGIESTIAKYEELSVAATAAQKAYTDMLPTTGTVEQNEGWIAEKEAKLVDAKKDVAEKQAAVDTIDGMINIYNKLTANKEAADKAVEDAEEAVETANEAVEAAEEKATEAAEAAEKAEADAKDAKEAADVAKTEADEKEAKAKEAEETAEKKDAEATEAEAAADEADKTVLIADKELEDEFEFDGYEVLGAWDICWSLHGVCLDHVDGAPKTITLDYEAVDGEVYTIFHILKDGTVEEIIPTVKDGVISFTTTSFSPFVLAKAVVAEPTTEDEAETPDTGALTMTGSIAGAEAVTSFGVVAGLATIALLAFAAKKSLRK